MAMMAIPCHAQENHWLTVNQWFFSVFNSTKGKIVNQGRPPNACAAAWNDWWKAVVLGVPPLQPGGMSGGVQCAIFWTNRKGHLKIIWYKWQYNMILHGAIIWYYMCISNKLCHVYIYTYIYAAIIIICYCLCVYGLCIWTIYHHYISYDTLNTLIIKKENSLANSPKLSLGNQLDRIGWSQQRICPQVNTCQMLIIFDHFEHVNQACRTARWV